MWETWVRSGRRLVLALAALALTMCVAALAAAAAAPGTPGPPHVVSPAGGEVVEPEHTFTGTAAVGATVTISVRPLAPPQGGGPTPLSIEPPRPQPVTVDGRWEISLDHPLPAGTYLVTATQRVGELSSPASDAVSFEVATPAVDDPEPSASIGPAVGLVLLAALAVGVTTLFVIRRRRQRETWNAVPNNDPRL